MVTEEVLIIKFVGTGKEKNARGGHYSYELAREFIQTAFNREGKDIFLKGNFEISISIKETPDDLHYW